MPVKAMARPALSAASITSSSRIEPPGWMTDVAPASAIVCKPSAKGKKASDAAAEPMVGGFLLARGEGRIARFDRGDARGIHAAHLTRADAGGRKALGINNGVRFDMLADGEGEQHVGKFCLR